MMSHISTYTTDLKLNVISSERAAEKDASRQLFRQALESVAEDHDGYVDDSVVNYFGQKRRCTFALRVPEFHQGLGIDVDPHTGQVSFVYDSYGVNDEIIEQLKEEVTQTFTTLAVSEALKELNYELEYREHADDRVPGKKRVVLRGVM